MARTTKVEPENGINLVSLDFKEAVVHIVGTGDLVLNKMNARSTHELTDWRDNKALVKPANKWEDILTAVRWDIPFPKTDTYELNEDDFKLMLKTAHPLISSFGMKKSWCKAVTDNELATYSNKFNAAVNIVDPSIIVNFGGHEIDERLMSPKRGSPVMCRLNHFKDWDAVINIRYTENVYNLEQILNIINIAGFCSGIGSGRSSGFGRYKVESVITAKVAAEV